MNASDPEEESAAEEEPEPVVEKDASIGAFKLSRLKTSSRLPHLQNQTPQQIESQKTSSLSQHR
jgi:hypothetical protein